jgi:hypothetical protein
LAALEDTSAEPAVNAPPALSWTRFVMGLDQAIEAIRRNIDARLLQEEEPAKTEEPDATLLDQENATRPIETNSSRERAAWEGNRWFDAEANRLDAVDAAIGSWRLAEPSSAQSVFPILSESTLTRLPNRTLRVVELKDGATLFPSDDVDRSQLVDVQLSRAVTLVAISAIAATAREGLVRIRRARSSGNPPRSGTEINSHFCSLRSFFRPAR